MQPNFFDPELQNCLPGISLNSTLWRPDLPSRQKSGIPGSSYLYLRNSLYYFRYVFPRPAQIRLGRAEFRISLRTGHLRWAKFVAARLYVALQFLVSGDNVLNYNEVSRRMHILMQQLLEEELKKNDWLINQSTTRRSAHEEEESFLRSVLLPALDGVKALLSFRKAPVESKEEYAAIRERVFGGPTQLIDRAQGLMPDLLRLGVLREEEVSEEIYALIGRCYLEMESEYLYLLEERNRGNYAAVRDALGKDYGPMWGEPYTPPLEQPTQSVDLLPRDAENTGQTVNKSAAILFSEAMEKYVQAKLIEGRWKQTSLPDNRHRLEVFLEIVGDKPILEISRVDLRSFRDMLMRLPPNYSRTKKYEGMTIAEIVKTKPEKTLSEGTVNTIVGAVANMLEWLVLEGYLSNNVGKQLQLSDDKQDIERHQPFTIEELKLIFDHPKFSQAKFKCAAYFWAPLVALFTGARLEEICQLHCSDIYQVKGEEGLWVIDINEQGLDEDGVGKTLKTKNARRIIPIHEELINLGLLDYHAHVKKRGNVRLFPELQLSDKVKKFGKQPGKQFKDVVKSVLKDNAGKSFNSLRHAFCDHYKKRGWQNDFFRQVFGHSQPTLASSQYGGKFPPRLLYDEVISKLDYGLDLNGLKGKFI